MIEQIKITSFQHLEEYLYVTKGDFIYRGLDNASYELIPSFIRHFGYNNTLELKILNDFSNYISIYDRIKRNFWETLALAQHYGLPTRLMDWSFSPFISLYFIIEDSENKNAGALWQLNIQSVFNVLPAQIIGTLNKLGTHYASASFLEEYFETFDILQQRELRYLNDFNGPYAQESNQYYLFYEPPSIDERIINQRGLFTLPSRLTLEMEKWLRSVNSIKCNKFIIPLNVKNEIRNRLDVIGINERMIYPGLEGISKWLVRINKMKNEKLLINNKDDTSAKNKTSWLGP